jgi:hypothetical protein
VGLSCAKLRLRLAIQLGKLGLVRLASKTNEPNFKVWLHLEQIECQINFHGGGGWGGVLDQMKIRLTQPQVELELANNSN